MTDSDVSSDAADKAARVIERWVARKWAYDSPVERGFAATGAAFDLARALADAGLLHTDTEDAPCEVEGCDRAATAVSHRCTFHAVTHIDADPLGARPPVTGREAVHQAIYEAAVDHPMWIGDDGEPLDYLPEREAAIGDFVDAAADAVLAALPDRDETREAQAFVVEFDYRSDNGPRLTGPYASKDEAVASVPLSDGFSAEWGVREVKRDPRADALADAPEDTPTGDDGLLSDPEVRAVYEEAARPPQGRADAPEDTPSSDDKWWTAEDARRAREQHGIPDAPEDTP